MRDKIADLTYTIQKAFPSVIEQLRKAHIKQTPEAFIKRTLVSSFMLSAGLGVFGFFMLNFMKETKMSTLPEILALPFFIVCFVLIFLLLLNSPITKIKKRMRDLDKEVLFAGRFLLVKIHSGRPLLNALIDASQSYGIAGAYFKEIVDDVNMGTSIEDALDNAIMYSPSDKFRKVIFQISNAIKIGIDVSGSLSNALDEISREQLIEIQKYGKKLNTLAMFYMLLAVVMPSLGVAMLFVIGTLMGKFTEDTIVPILVGVLGFLFITQFIFLMIFKSTRLTVNI